jgi:hypothetical protein
LLRRELVSTIPGLAVDVHTAGEPKRLKWLIANVRKFGFSWEVVPEEPWHLRYTEGDNPPAAVAEYMAKNNIQKPSGVVASAAPAAAPAGKDDGGDLDPGDSGPRVTKLQEELAERGFYNGEGAKAGKRILDDLGIGL